MWAKIRGSSRALTNLFNESDRARLNSVFAIFSLKRRVIAATLAALGIFLLFGMSHSSGNANVKTLVAIKEIESGAVILHKDVALREVPVRLVADGSFRAVSEVIGHIAVGAIRRGEVITDARLAGPSLLNESDLVAIVITLSEIANAQLVHAGDHVDVLASQNDSIGGVVSTPAVIVAGDVEVLSTRTHESNGVVVLAVSASQAQAIAGVYGRITLVLLGK